MDDQQDAVGIGIDTTLLQGAVSYLKAHRRRDALADPFGVAAFTHAVDAHLDTVPVLFVVPEDDRGYLPSIAGDIADGAAITTIAHQLAPLAEVRGVELYREHLLLLDADESFLDAVVRWSWYQFFDADTLLGYHTRMQYESVYLDTAMGRQFDAAAAENPARIERVTTAIALHCANDFKAHKVPIRKLLERYGVWSGPTHDAADAIEHDVGRLEYLAKQLHFSPQRALALLVIAFSGSVCRRGWQYGAVYRQRTQAESYLPHPLRSTYMQATTPPTEQHAEGDQRIYFWSWGSLLARAIYQMPKFWTDDRLSETLTRVRAARLDTSFVWNGTTALDEVLHDHARACRELRQLALDCGIVVTTDEVVDRWNEILTWTCRLLPIFGVKALTALQPVLQAAMVPVELATEVAVNVAEQRFESKIDRFVARLRDCLLAHLLRVGGEGVARKIVGLEWSENDSIIFAAKQPTMAPSIQLH